MPRLAFVDDERVAVGVAHHRHVADGRLERAHAEWRSGAFQIGDGGVEIVHLQRDDAAVARGLPAFVAADSERACADVVFDPVAFFAHVLIHGRLEAEDALVKGARPRHVGDGVARQRRVR